MVFLWNVLCHGIFAVYKKDVKNVKLVGALRTECLVTRFPLTTRNTAWNKKKMKQTNTIYLSRINAFSVQRFIFRIIFILIVFFLFINNFMVPMFRWTYKKGENGITERKSFTLSLNNKLIVYIYNYIYFVKSKINFVSIFP